MIFSTIHPVNLPGVSLTLKHTRSSQRSCTRPWLFPARARLPRKPGLPLHHRIRHSLFWVASLVPGTHLHAVPCVLRRPAHTAVMSVTGLCCDYNIKTRHALPYTHHGKDYSLFFPPSPAPGAVHDRQPAEIMSKHGGMTECINTHKQRTVGRREDDAGGLPLLAPEAIFPFPAV